MQKNFQRPAPKFGGGVPSQTSYQQQPQRPQGNFQQVARPARPAPQQQQQRGGYPPQQQQRGGYAPQQQQQQRGGYAPQQQQMQQYQQPQQQQQQYQQQQRGGPQKRGAEVMEYEAPAAKKFGGGGGGGNGIEYHAFKTFEDFVIECEKGEKFFAAPRSTQYESSQGRYVQLVDAKGKHVACTWNMGNPLERFKLRFPTKFGDGENAGASISLMIPKLDEHIAAASPHCIDSIHYFNLVERFDDWVTGQILENPRAFGLNDGASEEVVLNVQRKFSVVKEPSETPKSDWTKWHPLMNVSFTKKSMYTVFNVKRVDASPPRIHYIRGAEGTYNEGKKEHFCDIITKGSEFWGKCLFQAFTLTKGPGPQVKVTESYVILGDDDDEEKNWEGFEAVDASDDEKDTRDTVVQKFEVQPAAKKLKLLPGPPQDGDGFENDQQQQNPAVKTTKVQMFAGKDGIPASIRRKALETGETKEEYMQREMANYNASGGMMAHHAKTIMNKEARYQERLQQELQEKHEEMVREEEAERQAVPKSSRGLPAKNGPKKQQQQQQQQQHEQQYEEEPVPPQRRAPPAAAPKAQGRGKKGMMSDEIPVSDEEENAAAQHHAQQQQQARPKNARQQQQQQQLAEPDIDTLPVGDVDADETGDEGFENANTLLDQDDEADRQAEFNGDENTVPYDEEGVMAQE